MHQKVFINPDKLSEVTSSIGKISSDPSFTMIVLTKVFKIANLDGLIFSGIENTISEELKCKESTVKKALEDLAMAGAIKRRDATTFYASSELVRFQPLN